MNAVVFVLLSILLAGLAVDRSGSDSAMVPDNEHPYLVYPMAPGCPDAGPDTLVCGFMYQLEGSDTSGFWGVICSKSDGVVSFSDAAADTTTVKVEHCGEYTFVYEVASGPCTGTDTVIVKFENPSTTEFTNSLTIDLEMVAECHTGPTAVVCDNVVEISGLEPPALSWNFCATETCVATTYSTTPGIVIDSCILDTIGCDTAKIVSTDMNCEVVSEVTGDNYLDIITGLFDGLSTNCPIPLICFPPPAECIVQVIDTTILHIPVIDGGLWHYLDEFGNLQPLNDTSLLVLNGKNYVFYIEPGADYYGPDGLTFTILELVGMDFVVPTSNVDITLQWVVDFRYDTLVIIDTSFQLIDTCEWQPCGGVNIKNISDFPDVPDYPCGPINISFVVSPNDIQYVVQVDCNSPGEDIETCIGQFQFFDQSGFYTFDCLSAEGCPYAVYVEVIEYFVNPQIFNITTQCDSDNQSYSVSFDVIGGQGDYILEGVGVFTYGEVATVSGIASCSDFLIHILDPLSSCTAAEIVTHCCDCNPVNSQVAVSICEGDSYDFYGQILISTGIYRDTLSSFQGCDSVITLSLNVYQGNTEELHISRCAGDSYDFYGEELNATGVYYEQMQNQHGCDSVEVLNLDFEVATITLIDLRICAGAVYDFYGQLLQSSGVYTHTLTGSNGCDSILELSLGITELAFEISTSADCLNGKGGKITFENTSGGIEPYTYSLDNINFGSTPIFTGLNSTSYTGYIQDANGCLDQKEIEIPEVGPLSIEIEDDYYLCRSLNLTIDLESSLGGAGDVEITWNDGSDSLVKIISEPGNLWIEFITPCENIRKEFTVQRDEAAPGDKIYIPNVFTPNGDGINDVFKPYFSSTVVNYEMYVYDRWGDVLIHMTNTEDSWDGSFLDKYMDPAVYVWWLRASLTGCNGGIEEVLLKGDVTLLK